MTDDRHDDGDPLGKRLARYSTGKRVIFCLIGAALLAPFGAGMVLGRNALAQALAESDDGTPYLVVGGVILGVAVLIALYGLSFWGSYFEIRRGGVRYKSGRTLTEMTWDEVLHIRVQQNVLVHQGSRHISWEVDIEGENFIHLSPSFLKMVPSVTSLVNLLKLHSGKEIDQSGAPLLGGLVPTAGRGERRERRPIEPRIRMELPETDTVGRQLARQEAADRLAAGQNEFAVERWLETQGLTAREASRMVKQLHEERHNPPKPPRDDGPAKPPKRKPDRPGKAATPFETAARKLRAGEPAPEVERWLKEQGVPGPAAAAMIDKILTEKIDGAGE